MKYLEGDIVTTVNGNIVKIISMNNVSNLLESFDDVDQIVNVFSKYPMNSKIYYTHIMNNDELAGVLIIHESDIVKN